MLLVPGTFAEHNRAEAEACTQRTAVRVIDHRADVGAVPAELQVGHGISGRLQAGLQPARNLIGVDAEEVGIGPPSWADDGGGGCGQSYLEIPAFGGAPWAGLWGLGVAHLEVEQLVRAGVGGGCGTHDRQAGAVGAAGLAGGIGGGGTVPSGRVEMQVLVADWLGLDPMTLRAGREGVRRLGCWGTDGLGWLGGGLRDRSVRRLGGPGRPIHSSGGNGSECAPWAVEWCHWRSRMSSAGLMAGAGVGGGCSVLAGIGGMCGAAPSSETSSAQRVPRKLRVGGRVEPWSWSSKFCGRL